MSFRFQDAKTILYIYQDYPFIDLQLYTVWLHTTRVLNAYRKIQTLNLLHAYKMDTDAITILRPQKQSLLYYIRVDNLDIYIYKQLHHISLYIHVSEDFSIFLILHLIHEESIGNQVTAKKNPCHVMKMRYSIGVIFIVELSLFWVYI